jgi:thiol-disulfide isomerase/thioredoxin
MNIMKYNLPALLKLLIIFALTLSLSACGEKTNQEQITDDEEVVLGFDQMELENFFGKQIRLEDFRQKKVLVNFWATWCRPCIAEMPSLERTKAILEQEDYIFLSISDESMEKIRDFADKNEWNFNYFRLKQRVTEFEILSLPTTIVFDENGVEVWRHVGIEEWDSEEILAKLRSL